MTFQQLSVKQRNLLRQSLRDFDSRWDENFSLLRSEENGFSYHGTRESAFYALALLIRQQRGDLERAVRIIHAILDLQLLSPGQIWHGTFPYGPEYAPPVKSPLEISALTPLARWQGDVLWGQFTAAFRERLRRQDALRDASDNILDQLSAALHEVFPVVWETYDPNWREFIFASFALILEDFDCFLPAETVTAMERAALEGLKGARFRAESGLTPLNTNVEVMHVFIFDAFSRRFQDPELAAYASGYASRFSRDYQKHHAVAEFNSPTYNGVVLSYAGLLRARSRLDTVRRMGEMLEEGLWQDFAEFYNPAMKTVSGPFSRAYGLQIDGTAFPMLIYLGVDGIPEEQEPPFGPETESASVICCSEVTIPGSVQRLLLASSAEERTVRKEFRELAERGEPGKNRSLCTATAWITDHLMIGALRGSTNTSHQLHAAVVHWRNPKGAVSGMRLRRRTADGRLVHLRTVLFEMNAAREILSGSVYNETTEPVQCSFEIESPRASAGYYTSEVWEVDGLRCRCALALENQSGEIRPAFILPEIKGKNLVWLNLLMKPGEKLRIEINISLIE